MASDLDSLYLKQVFSKQEPDDGADSLEVQPLDGELLLWAHDVCFLLVLVLV